jgi:predicted nucleic acid-binding protein
LETLAALPALPSLLLVGPRGAGKRECAARLAAAGGRALQVFDPQSVDKTRLDESLRLAQREALLLDAALYVGPIVDMPRGLDSHPGPLFVGIEATRAPRLATTRPMHELVLPLPSAEARSELWRRALPDLDTTAPARDFRLTPGEIAQAAREAQLAGLDEHTLRAAVHRRLRNELGELARRLPAGVRLDDLVLPPAELARVRELIARKRFAARVYGEWGFGGAVDYGKGLVALVSGPPGTGKTLLARAIAHEVGLDLYQVDLSQIFSRWVGETEKAIARVFEQAERAHAVLLFDEADALFAKRTDVKSSNDRYANLEVNYLLQRMEGFSGITILTTNFEDTLDSAFKRRLTFRVRFEKPDAEARAALWSKVFPSTCTLAPDVSPEILGARFEMTGANIRNAAVRAAFLAAAEERAVDLATVMQAAERECREMGLLVRSEVTPPEPPQPPYEEDPPPTTTMPVRPKLVPVTHPRR